MSYNVTFPSLGMEFKVNTTAFTIGQFSVQWYGVIIAVGVVLAILYALKSCKKMRLDQDRLIDVILVGLIGGIIGARLYYVIFYPGDMYLKDPMKIFSIRDGGLGIYGGVIGGMLFGVIMAKIRKLKTPVVLDVVSLGLLIGQSIGRWGNYVNQEAFGRETNLPWGMMSERTQTISAGPVHPCFLYESLWCALGFLLLHIFTRKFRKYDGQTFLLYLIWYGLGRFFIEGLRTDSLITPFFDFRVSQIVALITVVAAIALMFVFYKKTSLSGCGSKKMMAFNNISEEFMEEEEDGKSTIFGDLNDNSVQSEVLPSNENNMEESSPVNENLETEDQKASSNVVETPDETVEVSGETTDKFNEAIDVPEEIPEKQDNDSVSK